MYQNFDNMDYAIEEAMAEERLNSIDIDYLTEQIDDQLNNLLSSDNKKNFLKYFEQQLKDASRLQTETDIEALRESIYNLIIKNISDKFGLDVDDDIDIKKVAKHFYKFFVLDYVNNLSYFLKSYIIENRKDILFKLNHMNHINTKKIPEIDNEIAIIVNNIGDVVDIIYNTDIDFSDFLYYLSKHPESSSSVKEMEEYLETIMEEEDSVVKILLEPLVNEEEDFGEIYINVQMDLYNDFNEIDDEEE